MNGWKNTYSLQAINKTTTTTTLLIGRVNFLFILEFGISQYFLSAHNYKFKNKYFWRCIQAWKSTQTTKSNFMDLCKDLVSSGMFTDFSVSHLLKPGSWYKAFTLTRTDLCSSLISYWVFPQSCYILYSDSMKQYPIICKNGSLDVKLNWNRIHYSTGYDPHKVIPRQELNL